MNRRARIAAGDVNNDGYTDLMAVGLNSNSNLFYNNGDNYSLSKLYQKARARR